MTSTVGSGDDAPTSQHDNREAHNVDVDDEFMASQDEYYDEDDGDTVSVYPSSRLPPLSSSQRPELPWSPVEGLTVPTTSDM
jgi:hypothetical protein